MSSVELNTPKLTHTEKNNLEISKTPFNLGYKHPRGYEFPREWWKDYRYIPRVGKSRQYPCFETGNDGTGHLGNGKYAAPGDETGENSYACGHRKCVEYSHHNIIVSTRQPLVSERTSQGKRGNRQSGHSEAFEGSKREPIVPAGARNHSGQSFRFQQKATPTPLAPAPTSAGIITILKEKSSAFNSAVSKIMVTQSPGHAITETLISHGFLKYSDLISKEKKTGVSYYYTVKIHAEDSGCRTHILTTDPEPDSKHQILLPMEYVDKLRETELSTRRSPEPFPERNAPAPARARNHSGQRVGRKFPERVPATLPPTVVEAIISPAPGKF